MRPIAVTLLAVAILLAPATGRGQSSPPRVTVATNPIAIPFGAFSGELESALGGRITAGVGGTYDSERENLSWAQGKLKYYPGAMPLVGFAAGVTAGVMSTREPTICLETVCTAASETAPMVGFILDYNWLVGPRNRLVLGTGVGYQRVFPESFSRIGEHQFDGRLVVGWAF